MELTANAIQIVNANQNVLFSDTAIPGSCSIVHRDGSGLVTLRGLPNGQCRARFRVIFGGNIAIPIGQSVLPIALAIAINGQPVASTSMIVTPPAANQYFNVASAIYIDVPVGCCSQISVQNTSTIPIDVQNANLIVERVA